MCGIFGMVWGEGPPPRPGEIEAALTRLFRLSESRGKEASGIASLNGRGFSLLKSPLRASRFIRTPAFQGWLDGGLPREAASLPWAAIGHARLATDGGSDREDNLQPLQTGRFSCVHNGIIVNDDILWEAHPELKRQSEVDTEVFLKILEARSVREGADDALRVAFAEIEGTASVAVLDRQDKRLLLATNSGSLYTSRDAEGRFLLFASERRVLERMGVDPARIVRVNPDTAVSVCLKNLQSRDVPLPPTPKYRSSRLSRKSGHSFRNAADRDLSPDKGSWLYPDNSRIRRCARCVLPETMPFIRFDEDGVCNACRLYNPVQVEGEGTLARILERHRRSDGNPDCLVAFSGGRDSSYGLHVLKKVFGMNPIAFSYDWGVLTDIARRNQARMCAQLGIEHLVISADITRKRENIRKNIAAWLRRPDLGLIPLFMAGDKHFFYHANRLRKETEIPLVIFCDNFLEKVHFKAGFCGINNIGYARRIYDKGRFVTMSVAGRLKLAAYYGKHFLANPAYLNASLWDTVGGYLSYYVIRQDHLPLFQYVPWNEAEIDRVLIDEYDWETSKDTRSTWRIGDGTAAFYNYIYRTVAGFTENDVFRSNQIREGHIGRAEALERVAEENRPRKESILEYLHMIGLEPAPVLKAIHSMPRIYS